MEKYYLLPEKHSLLRNYTNTNKVEVENSVEQKSEKKLPWPPQNISPLVDISHEIKDLNTIKNIPEDIRWKIYADNLTKYFNLSGKPGHSTYQTSEKKILDPISEIEEIEKLTNQILHVTEESRRVVETKELHILILDLINSLPKTLRSLGKRILQILSQSNRVRLTHDGQLIDSERNSSIENSNIKELIHYLLRPHRVIAPEPVGWGDFTNIFQIHLANFHTIPLLSSTEKNKILSGISKRREHFRKRETSFISKIKRLQKIEAAKDKSKQIKEQPEQPVEIQDDEMITDDEDLMFYSPSPTVAERKTKKRPIISPSMPALNTRARVGKT